MADGVTTLVLVRHGESRATAERFVGGPKGCKGLSALGVRQAEALRDRLARTGEVEADVLLSSGLPRARETAEIVAPGLGALPVRVDEDLGELLPGEGDGLSYEDFVSAHGDADFALEPYRPLSPGGESFAEFQLRVGRTFARLVAEHAGRTVVAFCHGGVVDASLAVLCGLATQAPLTFDLRTRNTSLTEWERHPATADGAPPRWRLLRYNDAAHLADLGR